LLISFYEGSMFSHWILTNITSTRGNLHCRKTRIPRGDQLVIGGEYSALQAASRVRFQVVARIILSFLLAIPSDRLW
jgi:hypothetical protein